MTWQLLARQTDIGQSRTSVLNPLQWTLVILLLGLGALIGVRASWWIIVGVSVGASLNLLLLFSAYIYFMFRNPDALRSEGFSLQKLALEKGLVGDSISGMKTIDGSTGNLVVASQRNRGVSEEQQGS